ncbi:MAG: mechanosensitive ion channel family protein [Kiritimatiellae bacterium]|nr:mechanosensitive ion channel family protein [Kiritimatiellia bacterium]
MTNEVAVAAEAATNAVAGAGVAGKLSGAVTTHVAEGRALVDRVGEWVAEHGVDFAVNLAIAAAMFIAGWLAIKLVDMAIRKALSRADRKRTLLIDFVVSVVRKGCWTILGVMILGRLGVNVGPLVAGIGATGFILGFAFQESLGNLASGMMIALNEPFKVGDFVEAAGHSGAIVEVNMMATIMNTGDNKKIVLPNKSVWGGPIVNYSAMDTRRVDLSVGIAYESDIDLAVGVIRETLASLPGVLRDPEPRVAVASLDQSSVTLVVRPWCSGADYWNVNASALQSIKEALERAGVKIPYNQIEVHQAKS